MADAEFQVVFRGEITGELPEHAVKQNLAAMFKMPESRIEGLFSGRPVVVKKGVDEATARKFQRAFEKAGAVCELHDAGAAEQAGTGNTGSQRPDQDPAGASAAATPAASGASAEASPATGDERETGKDTAAASAGSSSGSGESLAAGSIAAAGDPNQTVVAKAVPEQLGDLSLGAPGEPLATEQRDKTPPDIDTSEFTISDEPLGDGRRTTGEDPNIDTSDLSLLHPDGG